MSEDKIKEPTSVPLSGTTVDKKNKNKEAVVETAKLEVQKDKKNKDEKDKVVDKEDKVSFDLEEKEEKVEEVEDLPEEIKKRLEKRKNEKNKKKTIKRKKKGPKKEVKVGRAYVKATYNNTIVTLTDLSGDVISWASAGMAGFKGAKKATPYAAQIITRIAVSTAREEFGLEEVSAFVKGVGTGRESAVRALNANGLSVTSIKDITPVPHNGCRAKKPRRV